MAGHRSGDEALLPEVTMTKFIEAYMVHLTSKNKRISLDPQVTIYFVIITATK